MIHMIEFLRPFRFAHRTVDLIEIPIGVYHIKADTNESHQCFERDEAGSLRSVSESCAELALSIGVGKSKAENKKASSGPTGKAKGASSSPRGRASKKKTSKKPAATSKSQ